MIYFYLSLISIIVLFLLYNIVVYYFTRVPHIKSKSERLDKLFANLEIKASDNIYELGCGTAEFLFRAEKYHPAKLIGFELSPAICWYAQLKAKFRKTKIQIKCQNFFKADLRDADILYLFLVEKIVQDAWQKIIQEAKPGTLVIVLNDEIKNVKAEKVLNFPQSRAKISFYRV